MKGQFGLALRSCISTICPLRTLPASVITAACGIGYGETGRTHPSSGDFRRFSYVDQIIAFAQLNGFKSFYRDMTSGCKYRADL